MSWVSRVWGGPFKTPPLEHPITVGWVLLKLFETIWRLFLILIIVAAVSGLGLWLTQKAPLSTQVKVTVATKSSECTDPEYPVRVTMTNQSGVTLGEIDLEFRLYERGQSVDVAAYPSKRSELHDILKPGYELSYCFRMPKAEPGTTGPYTVAVDVDYAVEVSKDVPIAVETPPIVTTPVAPPPIVRTNVTGEAPPKKRTGWVKAMDYAGVFFCLALFGVGGFGFLSLGDALLKTTFKTAAFESEGDLGCALVGIATLANGLIVVAASYALSAAGLYGWVDQIDKWSRSNGFADGGVMLVTALAAQWPWLFLLALNKSGANGKRSEAQ